MIIITFHRAARGWNREKQRGLHPVNNFEKMKILTKNKKLLLALEDIPSQVSQYSYSFGNRWISSNNQVAEEEKMLYCLGLYPRWKEDGGWKKVSCVSHPLMMKGSSERSFSYCTVHLISVPGLHSLTVISFCFPLSH